MFGQEPFSSHLRLSNIEWYRYDWVYQKSNGANFLNLKYSPNKIHENIIVFSNMTLRKMKYFPQMDIGKPYSCNQIGKIRKPNSCIKAPLKTVSKINNGDRYPKSILKFKHDKQKLHPTQKPVALLEYLIKTYTNEGDTVLDNVMGSGSTGVACINTNRHFIGIEKDEKYYQIAKKRIEYLNNKITIEDFLYSK